jgi:hypothetical protein
LLQPEGDDVVNTKWFPARTASTQLVCIAPLAALKMREGLNTLPSEQIHATTVIHSLEPSKLKPLFVHIEYIGGLDVVLLYLFNQKLKIQAVLGF